MAGLLTEGVRRGLRELGGRLDMRAEGCRVARGRVLEVAFRGACFPAAAMVLGLSHRRLGRSCWVRMARSMLSPSLEFLVMAVFPAN